MSTTAPIRADLLAELAGAAGLSVDEVDTGEDLVALGIDSIGLMRLVDAWQARGLHVSFPDLAACPTVGDAIDLAASA